MSPDAKRWVVLDRDGTIIVQKHYLSDPGEVELLPGAAEALKRMSRLGLGLVVVTNQSGVGRGLYSRRSVKEVNDRMLDLLARQAGVVLDAIYYCPHAPWQECSCRKPAGGMLRAAAEDFAFDPAQSFVIGDKPCDIELGLRAGATTILVRTGYGAEVEALGKTNPHHVVDDLSGAARLMEAVLRHTMATADAHETPTSSGRFDGRQA